MPVSYRVWVQGFDDDERAALAPVFARRSLIAYVAATGPGDAQLVLADADRPQLVVEAGLPGLDPATTLWAGHAMPAGARWHVPRPVDGPLVLRTLDELVARERPMPERVVDAFHALWMRRPRPGSTAVGGMDRPVSDASPRVTGPSPPASASAVGDRRRPAAASRAALRRALRGLPASPAASGSPSSRAQALVVDAHGPSRVETGVLLEAFGFRVAAVGTVVEAERALWTRPFAVAVLASGGPAGGADEAIDLCHRIKRGAYGVPGLPPPKVVMRTGHPRAADPVRARLAGCDHFVAGEATRGALARALEAIELPMPADPRRAG